MKNASFLYIIVLLAFSCSKTNNNSHLDWVFVEGGVTQNGMNEPMISPGGDTIYGYSTPEHKVKLNDFFISKYEITVRQYREYCNKIKKNMPDPPAISAYGKPINYTWKDEYPMLVTWEEANAYADWIGGRLPTEAEWEYAAKGGQKSHGYAYSGGDTAQVVGWVRENADSTFRPIGLLKSNELGLYDMTGNLNEWVSDWWDPGYDYLSGPYDNPKGPKHGKMKISKGGNWYYGASNDQTGEPLKYTIHRPEVRYQSPINERTFGFGFRVVKDVE